MKHFKLYKRIFKESKDEYIFIRLASKKEATSTTEKRKAMNSFLEKDGYEIVYMPYGEQGRGFYYKSLTLTEDLIDDLSSGDSKVDVGTKDNHGNKEYKVVNVKDNSNDIDYKSFSYEENFTLDKASGIESDPYFKYQIKTENDNIGSKNYFYTIYFNEDGSDTESFPYFEYGAISTSESELYQIARDKNIEKAIMGRFIDRMQRIKNVYRYQIVWPFEDGK